MVRFLREFVYFVVALIELLLTFRFILKLLGASAQAEFVAWIYETTLPLLQPFTLAFPTPTVRGGFILEFTTLFAIFAYAFIGYLIQELLVMIAGRSR
jgi:hypothetical protein